MNRPFRPDPDLEALTALFQFQPAPRDSQAQECPTDVVCLVFSPAAAPLRAGIPGECSRRSSSQNTTHVAIEARRISEALDWATQHKVCPTPCRTIGCLGCPQAHLPTVVTLLLLLPSRIDFARARESISDAILDVKDPSQVIAVDVAKFRRAPQFPGRCLTQVSVYLADTKCPLDRVRPALISALSPIPHCSIVAAERGRPEFASLVNLAAPCRFCRPSLRVDHAADPCPFSPEQNPLALVISLTTAALTKDLNKLLPYRKIRSTTSARCPPTTSRTRPKRWYLFSFASATKS